MSAQSRQWREFPDLFKNLSLIVFFKLPLEGWHSFEIFEDSGMANIPWLSVVGSNDYLPGHFMSLKPFIMPYYPFDEIRWDALDGIERSREFDRLKSKIIKEIHGAETAYQRLAYTMTEGAYLSCMEIAIERGKRSGSEDSRAHPKVGAVLVKRVYSAWSPGPSCPL